MRQIAVIALGALMSVGAVHAQDNMSESIAEAKADGELVEGKSSFRETWVNPSVDFTQYDKILLGEAEFEFRDVGPAKKYRSTMRTSSSKQEYGILEEDRQKFKDVVGEAFVKELSKSKKYEIVTDASPGTILLEGAVLDIVSHVPPEMVGRSEIYLSSVATVTLVLELHDAVSGEVLAYVEERRRIEPPGGGRIDSFTMPANSVTIWSDIGRWARSSASRLRKSMEKAQKS
jgi:Protein of unknown function (DUF3313)